MFFLKSVYCRIFQGAFRIAMPLLPYRDPEIISSCNEIGEVLFSKCFVNFALKLLAAVIGAIIYYVVITLVLRLGLESTDLKLLTALVVAVFLSVPYFGSKRAVKVRK